MCIDKEKEILAAAICEIRELLADHLGSQSDSPIEVRLAAHLAYALHNEAESVLVESGKFDVEAARQKIQAVKSIVGAELGDSFGVFK